MSKGFQLFLAALAAGVVITAAFSPGKQTIGGIQALGNATTSVTRQAEGL